MWDKSCKSKLLFKKKTSYDFNIKYFFHHVLRIIINLIHLNLFRRLMQTNNEKIKAESFWKKLKKNKRAYFC